MAINHANTQSNPFHYSSMQQADWISQAHRAAATTRAEQITDAFNELDSWAKAPSDGPATKEELAVYEKRRIVANTISVALKTPKAESLNLSLLAEMPNIGPLPQALITLLHLHPHIKSLNLAGYPKISLPENIFELPKTLKIDLSGAQLRHAIFKDIDERMKDVSYEGPRFENYPQIPEKPTLEELKIDLDSWAREATPEFAKGRAAVSEKIVDQAHQPKDHQTSLTLSFLNCDEIPGEMFYFQDLHTVDFGANTLTRLPREFFRKLPKLENVFLSNNRLTELPKGIENLTSLRILNLKNNRLTKVPNGLANLTTLVSLNLASNQIKTVDARDLPPNVGIVDLSRKKPLGKKDPHADSLKDLIIPEGALPQLTYFDLNGNIGLKAEHISYSIFTLGSEKETRPVLNFAGTGVTKDTYTTIENKATEFYSNQSGANLASATLPYPPAQLRF